MWDMIIDCLDTWLDGQATVEQCVPKLDTIHINFRREQQRAPSAAMGWNDPPARTWARPYRFFQAAGYSGIFVNLSAYKFWCDFFKASLIEISQHCYRCK